MRKNISSMTSYQKISDKSAEKKISDCQEKFLRNLLFKISFKPGTYNSSQQISGKTLRINKIALKSSSKESAFESQF